MSVALLELPPLANALPSNLGRARPGGPGFHGRSGALIFRRRPCHLLQEAASDIKAGFGHDFWPC